MILIYERIKSIFSWLALKSIWMFICALLVVRQSRKYVIMRGKKKEKVNRALAMYMYFTQEKTNLRDCTLSWHWLHCLCIRLHTGGLSDITNWWYYFNFYYVQNLLPPIQCVPLLSDWVKWKFILLWVWYAVYCSFGEKFQ